MYFKKLELLGFKSFAEKTALYFEPGITAVVGPNGCGKSNIFDSIRWVLGEQSVKSMRGSKMEDVIFNGTENIPALGYAEVSLTFSNETRALPVEFDEVTVTRRLYRSGESEYLLNKTQVRLKDILETFMGTGIGAESYSLIEQGKIDLILSSRPEERRMVFDEASGISRYKSQKRETLRKLEDTEANLLRLTDIIAEVRRQINSLERQAAKAKRYKEIFEKLKELEGKVSGFESAEYQKELDRLSESLNELTAREAEQTRLIGQQNSEFSQGQDTLTHKEEILNQTRTQLNNLENNITRDDQQLNFNRERGQELNSRLQGLQRQKEELSLKASKNQERINNFKSGLETMTKELDGKKALELKLNNELTEITRTIDSLQENVRLAKNRILEFAAEEAASHNQLQDFVSEIQAVSARKKRLDIERLKTNEELSGVDNDLKTALSAQDEAFKKFSLCKEEFENLKAVYENSLRDKEGLISSLQSLEIDKLTLESQKEFLETLKLKYENISESANATVLLDSFTSENISGIIIKVNTIEAAAEGDLAAMASVKFKARGTAKPISLDPKLLEEKLEKLKIQLTETNNSLGQKNKNIEELSLKISSQDANLRENEIECNNRKNHAENIQKHLLKLKEEAEVIAIELSESGQEIDTLSRKEKTLKDNLREIKEESENNQKIIDQRLQETAAKNIQREEIAVSSAKLKAEIQAGQEKVLKADETCRIFEEEYLKDKSVYEAILGQELNIAARLKELETTSAELILTIAADKKQKTAVEDEVALSAAELEKEKHQLRALEAGIRNNKETVDSLKAEIHKLQLRSQELAFLRNSLFERISQVYTITPDELKNYYHPDTNREELSTEIDLLKQKIHSYGQVNLVAIEEFEELKQRFDFLSNQQADLIKAKESLHEAILKINRVTKKMFMETFEKLAVEFKKYFRLLFGGGDAQLFLLDEQDVLESGIEIVCRPPGKKLQNVLLLSGGEKSMSAIALLFAIFKVKPSPFCVLDEIDAALDEANVDRFARTLVEFTAQSQFIVITHNKKTIANANIMYGITMEKAGISKIVSVKLADNVNNKRPEQAAAPVELPAEEQKVLNFSS